MFLASFKRWFQKRPAQPVRRASYRPEMLALEDRLAPAVSVTWVGPANGDWSLPANWAPAQVPVNGDTVIFDGTNAVGANTASNMNLGGGVQYHIGKLIIRESHTRTITLGSNLRVDVLDMDGGAGATIASTNKFLEIYQRTDSQEVGAATIFATSSWRRGTISAGGGFAIEGEANHIATLQIGAAGGARTLDADMSVFNEFATVNWTLGDVTVNGGKTITNNGVFSARAGNNTFGNNVAGAQNVWTFSNNRDLIMIRNQLFPNMRLVPGQGGNLWRRAALDGTDPSTTEIAGTLTQDETDTLTQIESGTLLISGDFSQTKGAVNTMADTFLTVTGNFTQSADASFDIELITPESGSGLVTVAGTVTLNGSTLNVTGLPGFEGSQFTLIKNDGGSAVVGRFDDLDEGATLSIAGVLYRISYFGGESGYDVVLNRNEAPTDIELSNNTVAENEPVETVVGTFTASDPDSGDEFTYNLVAGTGDDDNGSFQIVGDELRTAASFDYETQSSYSIRVQVADAGGLTFEKVFSITVTDVNEAPTDIELSNNSVLENQPLETVVGTFTGFDPDSGDTFTYALVTGTGDDDNASFQIVGDQLQTAETFDYETKSSYTIRVRVTDAEGLTFEKMFTITILDEEEL